MVRLIESGSRIFIFIAEMFCYGLSDRLTPMGKFSFAVLLPRS